MYQFTPRITFNRLLEGNEILIVAFGSKEFIVLRHDEVLKRTMGCPILPTR